MNEVKGPVEQSAEQARFDAAKLHRLADYNRSLVASGRVRGASFLLARYGKVFGHQGFGELVPDSLFRVASITKLFTATAIVKLIEDGRLWLEQPVATVLPEFDTALHRGINLWHLLTHTSGLPADGGYFAEPYPVARYSMLDQDDWLKAAVLSGPLACSPGAQWNYSTMGYLVLGEVVSRVSGRSYEDYVEAEVFAPLGMDHSFLKVPEALRSRVVVGSEDERTGLSQPPRPSRPPRSGGGAYSTLADLARFATSFLPEASGPRVLSKKGVAAMTRNQLTGVPAFHWGKRLVDYRHGLGWGFFADGNLNGPEVFCHDGWGWSTVLVDPLEHFVYVAMAAEFGPWDAAIGTMPRTIAFSGIL